jgi:hypothetical protein
VCERKKLDGDGTCGYCGKVADLGAEELSELSEVMMRFVAAEEDEPQRLERVRGRKKPISR